ncbi:MAG TPA: hypothetical protein VGD40_06865 [Chryseosolibacter sp.]
MELLETDDPIKGQLLQRSAKHRAQLEEDARLISEKTEKMLTNALIIGGALAVTYFVVSSFSGKKKKKSKTAEIRLVHGSSAQDQAAAMTEPEPPGMMAQIGTALAAQATAFMLSLAKDKLMEFLESQAAKKQSTNDPAKNL